MASAIKKTAVVIIVLATCIIAGSQQMERAGPCDAAQCKLPNCKCATSDVPGGLKKNEIPQFVLLTFDDAITVQNIEYYRQAIFNRRNPNNCTISATYFASHEYTDYSFVHELHSRGQEIALHSLSHHVDPLYWRNASIDLLTKEFAGERQTISKFANISLEDIKGIRLPFLQMSGDQSFLMMKRNNLLYDCSWTTQAYIESGIWPYTTDNLTIQDCLIGPCPTSKIPGVWVIPMIDWRDTSGNVCAMLDACVNIPTKTDDLVQYMIGQFNRTYHGSKAPFGVFLHAAWFAAGDTHFPAYLKFLDYLLKLQDVYVVSGSSLIEWVKSPIKLADITKSNWGKCPKTYQPSCKPINCQLIKEGKEERWMRSCNEKCPSVYPWIDIPLGEKK